MSGIEYTETAVVIPKGQQMHRIMNCEQLLSMAFTELEALKALIEEERRARLEAAKYPYGRR
jgi:hypothetical protein